MEWGKKICYQTRIQLTRNIPKSYSSKPLCNVFMKTDFFNETSYVLLRIWISHQINLEVILTCNTFLARTDLVKNVTKRGNVALTLRAKAHDSNRRSRRRLVAATPIGRCVRSLILIQRYGSIAFKVLQNR